MVAAVQAALGQGQVEWLMERGVGALGDQYRTGAGCSAKRVGGGRVGVHEATRGHRMHGFRVTVKL